VDIKRGENTGLQGRWQQLKASLLKPFCGYPHNNKGWLMYVLNQIKKENSINCILYFSYVVNDKVWQILPLFSQQLFTTFGKSNTLVVSDVDH
jgi:hypothetical protein